MLKKVRKQKGFTLIELIAIIAILGILSLLIVPRVANYSEKAKISKAKGNLTILKNAIERYNLEHTTSLDIVKTLDADISDTVTNNIGELLTGKTDKNSTINANGECGPYIQSVPDEWIMVTIGTIMSAKPENVDSTDFDNNDKIKSDASL